MDVRSEVRDQAIKSSDRLNTLLPLRLTPQEVEGNPEFVKLLTGLTKHINEQGVGLQTHKDLVQAQELLKHEKHTWLLHHILHHEVQELILDYEMKSQEMSLAADDKQFLVILRNCLTYSEIGDYLDFSPDPTSKATLLGLKQEDVNRHNAYRKHISSVQQKLIPEIEARLQKKCENLVTFYQPPKLSDSTRLTLSKAVQLPGEIETNKHRLSEDKKQVQVIRQKRDKQFWLYYQTLLDLLSVLEKVLKDHKLDRQVESDLVTSEWLIARCDAMCLKIKLVQLQIMCDTYTAETVQALDVVRKHLDSAIDDHEKDMVRVGQALRAYEAVGMGFDGLVEEYTRLRGELENKQWALAELQQTTTQTTG
ncbi:HAUS augmin-like complex subunit 4 [Haliotis cracherodii]|uniref:HAUS augmin-like complex subunit 4 n=1 Tax=Haliotis cracherodii TaxID=6455 RepID=UPI0039E8E675